MKPGTLFDERKTAQAAAYLLHRAGGALPVVKLLKLLYLAKRLSFKHYEEPLTDDSLVSMPHGPVLSMTYDHINGSLRPSPGGWDTWISDRENHVVALRDPSMIREPERDLIKLSESDLDVLGETWGEFGYWDQWKLVDHTHSSACPEWEDPHGSSRPITYRQLFRALGYASEQIEALEARLNEQIALAGTFDYADAA